MPNFKCIAEYDGTNFNGWGKQPGQRTVQDEIEKALKNIFKTALNVTCAGRTDKGVHAAGQVISFQADDIPTDKLILRLNSLLSKDVSIKSAEIAPESFDARKSAKFKTYMYAIRNSPYRSPLYENRSWHISKPLDILKMRDAANFLQHKRDYSVFDSYNSVFDYKTVDLKKVSVIKRGSFVIISVTGDRFLYKMARKIAGELVRIGKDEQTLEDFKDSIINKNKAKTGKPAPACGLYLLKIIY